ncbi:MAG: DNA-directed RNA polymerase subunit omega [Firmicutes bacterium]|nr:DNA-directed RNA polymerase subunit omega [Bacillota bacterium]
MNQPSLDELMEKVDSRYTLVVVAAKRARMLTEKTGAEGGNPVAKPVTAALHEISRNKITYRRTRQGIK